MNVLFKFILTVCLVCINGFAYAQTTNEFKVKRENDFNFKVKPTIEKSGEGFNISFEVNSFCDVTIVIEEENTGKILRHLISGVLGSNAPEPLQKNSKTQKVYFDGKNDAGEYLKNFTIVKARVSLGLSPQFERTLFDFPKRRFSQDRQLFAPVEEGVLVYDGGDNLDFVKLYNHTGEYLKTVYPFPGNKIKEIKGLKWKELPEGGGQFPVKTNFLQTSFLETGSAFAMEGKLPTNYGWAHYGMNGKSATFLAAQKNMVAFGMGYIARIGLDGTSGGMDFMGPAVGHKIKGKKGEMLVQPASAAIAPDGKKIYFTGYHYCNYGAASNDIITSGDWASYHHVYEMDLNSNEPPKIFLGEAEKSGKDDAHFDMPIYVYVDDSNRIYVCDYMNNRVQVFDQNKKLLKSVNVNYPAYITVLPKSKEIVLITHLIPNKEFNKKPPGATPILYYNLGKFENMAVGKSIALPASYKQGAGDYLYSGSGFGLGLCATDYSGDTLLWVSQEKAVENVLTRGKIAPSNVKIWKLKGEKFEVVSDFENDVKKDMIDTKPIHHSRIRLQVNPATGDLYTTRTIFGFFGKSFTDLFKINPATGKITIVPIAYDAEDFCFDSNGFLYLKSIDIIARYNIESGKEVPWDYGIETKASTSSSSDRKVGEVISGIKAPVAAGWHHGGIYVNAKGNLIVSGPYIPEKEESNKFLPEMYPGRVGASKLNNMLHIYDKYGKFIKSDVVPGLKDNYGVGLDQYNNIYVMSGATRMLGDKKYPNDWTGTIIKFPFEGAKLITKGDAPVPLPAANEPKRAYDLAGFWAENANWFFGGVGFMGKNTGTGCACWNSRMAFDYLNRTFAPELERYSVAILDSNGNLITRVGRYSNRDSMGPKSLVPLGGDEVGMIHGAYLGVMTDKFLYISDTANDRIVAVKLNYATNELIGLPAK
jgi:hypothetical protein